MIVYIGPIIVTVWSRASFVFARLNAEVLGSNSTGGMDVCFRFFCVYVLCVGRDPASDRSQSNGSYRLCM
jgi:hypothetical protein